MLKQSSIFSCYPLVILTLALILSAGPVDAANYVRYVDTGIPDKYLGSEKPDCSTYSSTLGKCGGGSATAYRSIEDVNKFIKTLESNDSASVYFKRGNKWIITSKSSNLNITKKNIYIGAFGSGNIPLFDGKDTAFDTQPLNAHAPLIQVSENNCTVEYIRLVNAYGSAIRFDSVTSGKALNCQIDKAGWAGVAIAGTSSGITVERCSITKAGYRSDLGPDPQHASHPQAIQSNTYSVEDCIFRYNHVYNCYTEGIGASGNTVEFNLVGPTMAPGIYSGEKPSVIRYNLAYGTNNAEYFNNSNNGRRWCSAGISLNEEKGTIDPIWSEIYGNIVIGRFAGLRVSNMTNKSGKKARIYNNTFIDNSNNLMVSKPEYWQATFKNNLSIVYDTKHCRHVGFYGDPSGWDIGPNQWSSVPEDSRLYNLSQDEIGDPRLPKTNGWTNLNGPTSFSFSDLVPPLNSTAINNSKAIKLSNSNIYQVSFLTLGTEFRNLPNNPTFNLIKQYDSGNYWDFGAIVVNSATNQSSTSPPPAPALWIVQ